MTVCVKAMPNTVREHFYAEPDYQNKLARFLENHDEPRVAATIEQKKHEAAAVITFLSPGLRFFHQGQFEGRKKRISPHLIRAPQEPLDTAVQKFYTEFLSIIKKPVFRDGQWKLLNCAPAWEGNDTWSSFLVFAWENSARRTSAGCRQLFITRQSVFCPSCRFLTWPVKSIQFRDLMSAALYDRDGDESFVERSLLRSTGMGLSCF